MLAGAQTAPPNTIEALDMLLQTFPKVGMELEVECLGAGPKRCIMTGKLLGTGATARVYLGAKTPLHARTVAHTLTLGKPSPSID